MFPDFYSGEDAGYYCLKAAAECHQAFAAYYRECRRYFNSVLRGIGLGVGIDYGRVEVANLDGGLTAVGAAVVYACRMSHAPAGRTYINQPADQLLRDRYRDDYAAVETTLHVKSEGKTVAYAPTIDLQHIEPARPAWAWELIRSTST